METGRRSDRIPERSTGSHVTRGPMKPRWALPDLGCLWPKWQGPRWLHLQCALSPEHCVGSRRRLWGKPTWNGMQKEKKRSPSPVGLLTLPFFFFQTTGCLELIYLGPNPLQPSHSSGKLSFLLCGLVCLWPSLSAGQVVTSLSPWNLRARFPKHLPTLSIAQNRSINVYLKLESLSTGKMCGDYMSPSPVCAPENDRLGPWPEEGFGLIPKSLCCHGSHPWYELLTVSLEVLTTHQASVNLRPPPRVWPSSLQTPASGLEKQGAAFSECSVILKFTSAWC